MNCSWLQKASGWIIIKQIIKSLLGYRETEFKKATLLIFLLLVALYFLYPGSDYTIKNRFLAAIKIWNSANINIDELSSSLSETDIISKHSGLDLDCGYEPSTLGARSCYNHVKSINGADAWHLAFFFKKDKLNLVKMDFTAAGHDEILALLKAQYGEPSKLENSKQVIPLINWKIAGGILSTNKYAYTGRTTQVLWLSNKEILDRWLKSRNVKNTPSN